MIRIPYGISDFETLVKENYFFVDKTPYIEWLENLNEHYLFFLRPRRFGKSLWISMFQHYYGLEHKEDFQTLFGSFYIGKKPTASANSYLVLRLEFSRINTNSAESTFNGFLTNVRQGVANFLNTYDTIFPREIHPDILNMADPEAILKMLFTEVGRRRDAKIFLLIDEYDHFANELLSFREQDFKDMVSKNGFVRKFYETIKNGTGEGIVDRLFVTGVSPLTLDSMTSGFNIGTNLSTHPRLNEMMGFLEKEVYTIMEGVGIPPADLPDLIVELRQWYNGYKFHPKGENRLYNPDMVLYFAKEFASRGEYTDQLLDVNIASDYGKIRKLFRIGGKEAENIAILEKLIIEGEVSALLTNQFNLEMAFTTSDFISLLYFMGMVTIKEAKLSLLTFQMPNAVIKELYYDYFTSVIQERANLPADIDPIRNQVLTLALENNPRPLIALVEEALLQLSNRNFRNFDEKYVQAIFTAYLHLPRLYFIKNEYELKQKYADILVLRRPPYEPPFQFLFELKYLKKKDAAHLESVTEEAKKQLRGYLQAEEVKGLPGLRGWVIVFVGPEAKVIEEVS